MRGGVILLIVALFIIYLGVSNKFCCFTQFLKCAVSNSLTPCECAQTGTTATSAVTQLLPTLPQLPSLPSLTALG